VEGLARPQPGDKSGRYVESIDVDNTIVITYGLDPTADRQSSVDQPLSTRWRRGLAVRSVEQPPAPSTGWLGWRRQLDAGTTDLSDKHAGPCRSGFGGSSQL
jgi:hypothetical protein